ncbi:hypothetical protein Goshw_020546, partial [Gossypium schwendimanii]|nr:hypothetical protein [Gossypium schwendimanii]
MAAEGVIDSFCDSGDAQPNRVMCQFEFRQNIPLSPQDIKELHKVDLYHSKSYLLSEEKKTKQYHQRRPRRPHMNPRSGVHALMESSSATNPQVTPMATPPSSQYGVFVAPPPSPVPYGVPMPTTTPTYLPSLTIPTFYPDNKRWKPRMTQHSSTKERKEDEDEGRGTPTTKKPSLQLTPT